MCVDILQVVEFKDREKDRGFLRDTISWIKRLRNVTTIQLSKIAYVLMLSTIFYIKYILQYYH